MFRFFTDHPASVGETYYEHLRMAFGFGGAMILGGLACLLHGLVPAWFETNASRTVARLFGQMVRNRVRRPASANWVPDFVI